MRQSSVYQRFFRYAACLLGALGMMGGSLVGHAWAQQPASQLKEPIYRISKARTDENINAHSHPLDPAIELAQNGLKTLRANVRDYTCVLVKRERIGDQLGDYEYMFAKVRGEQRSNGRVVVPFSVYLYFLDRKSVV